ncbi:Uncharacterised protein [uncultured Bacteroides sp.]|uniref:porin family protein n=1 Tax=Bacteroides cellulolyticus TaxID=2981780 RepID=UPI0008202CEB|nr:porin family protein [Bacteroides cellulolyticus]MCU6771757.1 porin family protein [Bacteroides cellulolyticus]SCI02615.1 Uncharacterised protein [uncultured Bacteroides sp.]
MKKLLMAVAMAFISVAGFAQSGSWSVGLNFGYGTDISKPFLGGRVMYGINDAFDVAGSFNYYFKDKYDFGYGDDFTMKWWDINADVHWNAFRGEKYKLYPLAGLTFMQAKASSGGVSDSDGKFGVNLGIGGSYDFTSHFAVGVELKAQIISGTQFVPMASFMYKF